MTWPLGYRGVDLSANQRPALCVHAAIATWADFAYLRLDEGNDVDASAPLHHPGLTAAGMRDLGGYCFNRTRHPALEEADIFLRSWGELPWTLPPCLDLERGDKPDTLTLEQLSDWAHAWLERVELVTGVQPIVYTGSGFVASALSRDHGLGKYGLWLADYNARPTLPRGWDNALAWQWTGTGSAPGVPGNADLSVCESLDALRGYDRGASDTDPCGEP